MKRHAPTLLLVAVILLLLAWYFRSSVPTPPPSTAGATQATVPVSPLLENPTSKIPPSALSSPTERSTLADALNSSKTDIRADLRLVSEVLDTFRTNFPREGNPVGTNAEIVAVLTGRNKLKLALIPPDHPAINKEGELCDRWGTPFFFHAESGTRMTIESAGPDKKRHTADDVAFTP
jgi:hypothetical protein